MIEELDRANSIITEYLSLARNKVVSKRPQKLNSIVEALLPLTQADAMRTDKYVEVELEDTPDLLLDEKRNSPAYSQPCPQRDGGHVARWKPDH